MLIREYNIGATNIKIYDDYMAKTPEENRIIKEHLDDIAYRINERVNREEMMKKKSQKATG